jgi:hypothetical protein
MKVLRERSDDASPRVTQMELFFDLVYVFAITQLSDFLFAHRSPRGALEALILFLAVWWAWNYTAWATNWIDPERPPVALLMVVLMAISLVMSAAIPQAFDARGLAFAAAYVLLQLVRSGFVVWAFAAGERMRRNYAQLLAWSAIAAVPWLVGAVVHREDRPAAGRARRVGAARRPDVLRAAGDGGRRRRVRGRLHRLGGAVGDVFPAARRERRGGDLRRRGSRRARGPGGVRLCARGHGRGGDRGGGRRAPDDRGPGRRGDGGVGGGDARGARPVSGGTGAVQRWVHRGALGPPLAGIAVLALLTIAAVAGVDRLALCVMVTLVLAALAVGAGTQKDAAAR